MDVIPNFLILIKFFSKLIFLILIFRENVCIEREETTDDDDNSSEKNSDDEDKKNETESVPNFFQTSISLSNCFQTPNKYECVTK